MPRTSHYKVRATISVHRPESLGCMLITPRLDENINHFPDLVDSPPQTPSLTLDSHEQFIQVPRVSQATPSSPEFHSVFGTELPIRLADASARLRLAPEVATSRRPFLQILRSCITVCVASMDRHSPVLPDTLPPKFQ